MLRRQWTTLDECPSGDALEELEIAEAASFVASPTLTIETFFTSIDRVASASDRPDEINALTPVRLGRHGLFREGIVSEL